MANPDANPAAALFKEREKAMRPFIEHRHIYGIRLDGKAFHTFTKQFKRPYDEEFMRAMDNAALAVLDCSLQGSELAYIQSDEISIIFTDLGHENAELPFNGNVNKILSTAASAATLGFLRSMPEVNGNPIFDARLFLLDDDLLDYMSWRRLDCQKNAITMAASMVKSHKQLLRIPTKQRYDLLKGTEWERLPEGFFLGRLMQRENYMKTAEHPPGSGNMVEVMRSRWVKEPATRELTEDVVARTLVKKSN
ncbi:MAG: tRNA(His) guanylyltransferase Thg1 family protein [Micrococcaceae bacterium]